MEAGRGGSGGDGLRRERGDSGHLGVGESGLT